MVEKWKEDQGVGGDEDGDEGCQGKVVTKGIWWEMFEKNVNYGYFEYSHNGKKKPNIDVTVADISG